MEGRRHEDKTGDFGLATATILGAASLPSRRRIRPRRALEKTEDGKPVVWILVVERPNNVFEGAIAKAFLRPEDRPDDVCAKCADDRKNSRCSASHSSRHEAKGMTTRTATFSIRATATSIMR